MLKTFLYFFTIIGFLFLLDACSTKNSQTVDFNTQIRPILNAKCLKCHGGVRQQGNFSLLFREDALAKGKSEKIGIVPFHPEKSELFARITTHDETDRMPLKAEALSETEIKNIKIWIEEGANWETHWAYIPPKTQKIPFNFTFWGENDLDKFVYAKLKDNGLSPSSETDKGTWLRRVSLDLIGLSPTQSEIQTFLADNNSNAYEKVVDRLLQSPHFGERWASMWLDLARYGDSQGYQKDRARQIWQYRDWVIDAFNKDMPFSQFTVEQLAGDLLPKPTIDQQIATAFHRNTNTNDEGGTDDEEFRVVAVLDRINTTFEVWQGTTIACVQCHSHPYDPFRHKEYYQLYAFFNNTRDKDRSDEKPTLNVLSSIQIKELNLLKQELRKYPDSTQKQYQNINKKIAQIKPSDTPVMVDYEPDSSRKTHLFERGNWLVHGQEVRPKTPKSLLPAYKNYPENRLGLANWLIVKENPLTARVTVNRFWEQLFGIGLVETLEDFGTQGAKPTHPELLDYLALRFMNEQNWSVKKMLREMVLSATYRQSSEVSKDLQTKDPYNKFLARGAKVRLTAEQVRDQALSVSGLLNRKIFGPSVMPAQPDGVWQTIRNVMRWQTDSTENRYRRGIYTYWRKSSPYPSFISFDAPSREFCVSRRIRTNTPLQALTTLNDEVYLEAAQNMAIKFLKQGNSPENALKLAYQAVMGTEIENNKLEVLQTYYQKTFKNYQQNPKEAQKLFKVRYKNNPAIAALTLTMNILLNLDEVLTKG